jgi:chromate transporter
MAEPAEPASPSPTSAARKATPKQLAALFLRLGVTAFGGPAAHIAMMEDEVVVRRKWLTRQQFLDLLGAANLIPGPTSSEMAIYIGQNQAGWVGLLLGGGCFILPAALLVGAIAWAYVRFGALPQVASLLYGIKPVVIAIVLQALWRLGRSAVKTRWLAALAIAAAVANIMGLEPVLILASAAVLALAARYIRRSRQPATMSFAVLASVPTASASAATSLAATGQAVGLGKLFLVFLKLGAVVFGSGYVLLAFLRTDLVQRLHWLTERQLLDAIAVGQVTPGPVFTTATFVGYILAGTSGAVVATVGIFLPAYLLVSVSGPLIPRIRRSPTAACVLDSINAASLALMAVVGWQLGRAAIVDWASASVALASAVLLIGFRLNSAWLVLLGAIAGLFIGR